MSDKLVQTYDPDDDRGERGNALDKFARAGEDRARAPAMIPAQAFNERIVGAQEVAVHRDTKRVLAEIKTLAAAAGQDWYYRFPVKNKRENTTDWIEGPSIKLANDLARLYGNCDVDVRVTDLGDNWLMYARFTDFETGFSITRPFQQRKNASKMGGDDARRLDIALQIGVSKSIRNVVVNALQTFADFAFEEAKSGLVEKIGQNIKRYRGRILEGLGNQKIEVKRVEIVVGRVSADWLAPDMARIIAMMKAVADGMATWDETFPPLQVVGAAGGGEKKPGATLDTFAAGETGTKAEETVDPTTGEIKTKESTAATSPAAGEGAGSEGPQSSSDPAPANGKSAQQKPKAVPTEGKETAAKPNQAEGAKPAAANVKAASKSPADWTDEECAEHGREAFRKGMSRRAIIPGELRAADQDHRAQLIEQAFDHAAAAANGQTSMV